MQYRYIHIPWHKPIVPPAMSPYGSPPQESRCAARYDLRDLYFLLTLLNLASI
jgi:hypothetical protein